MSDLSSLSTAAVGKRILHPGSHEFISSNPTHETKQANEYSPSASVAAQIDAMVVAAGALVEHLQQLSSFSGMQGEVKIGQDGTAQILDEIRETARIPGDSRDLNVERLNSQKRIDDFQAKLDAHTLDSCADEKNHGGANLRPLID
jgi:hypothetical protein